MNKPHQQKWLLPWLTLLLGFFLSLSLWYLLIKESIRVKTYSLNPIESYHPWLILIIGISVSALIAIMVRIAQIARAQALNLAKMNEDLKKEITDRISAEESKQKLEIAMLQGQKLQAMGTLAGGIAHDFNNLLYAINGYIEMARSDIPKDGLVYNNLGKVLEASHRGQELVARILSFSRRQQHKFDILDLKSTIEAALSLLRPTIPASVIIEFNPINNAMILGNQTQIHQVLVNLINNAVDAMDGEGVIHINMQHVLNEDESVKKLGSASGENYCKLEITDSGHGMNKTTIERIFEPFFTTKEVGKGTGLGLSIAHSIMKEHGGDITVKSQLGQGTTFILIFPEIKP